MLKLPPTQDRRRRARFELLLLAPLLSMLGAQIAIWGVYLWLDVRVRVAAEAAARSAGSGRDGVEAERRARLAAAAWLPPEEPGRPIRVLVQEVGGRRAVEVSYDASHYAIYRLNGLLPTPPATLAKVVWAPR